MDYNANINWIVAGQPDGRRLNVIKSFYVKFERKIPEVVADFCTYYASHRNKTVVYYYDATALGSNYAVNEQDFRWVVVHEFERHGWTVEAVYLGNPMRHDEKYLLINQGFAGKQRLMPFFNRQNNDDLILAIQAAGVSRGRNGFRKDKGGEKLAESEEDLLEHRTDSTDTFSPMRSKLLRGRYTLHRRREISIPRLLQPVNVRRYLISVEGNPPTENF